MANTAKTETVTGLGTFPLIVNETGFWNVKGTIQLPTITEGATINSTIVVTMNLNGGGAFYTGVSGAEGFASGTAATAGDTINVILTSAGAADQGLNVVKTTIVLY